jgi:hypothetical protein
MQICGTISELANQMKSNPEPSTQEALAGFVVRVTFHNAENGFCVVGRKRAAIAIW